MARPMHITPTNAVGQQHDAFEAEIAAVFEQHGFLTAKAPYHATMDRLTVQRLARCKSPTARYVRARSDRMAIHLQHDQVIQWEAKTSPNHKPRMPIQVLPLLHHLRSQTPVLYVCRHLTDSWDAAFWTNRLPKFDVIFLTPACDPYESGVVQRFFKAPEFWKWDCAIESAQVNGSGTAFALVSRESLAACVPDWRAEIARRATMNELDDPDLLSSEPQTCFLCGQFLPARTPHRCGGITP